MLKLDIEPDWAKGLADAVNERERLFSAKIPQRNTGDNKIWFLFLAQF